MQCELIVCDDIRVEANGKQILVGVYPTNLVPGPFPASSTVALWLRVSNYEGEPSKAKMTLIPPGGGIRPEIEISIDYRDQERRTILLMAGGMPLEIDRYGELKVMLELDGENPIEAGTLPIVPRPVPLGEAQP